MELRRLDAGLWKDRRFTGVRVPTLKEALAVLKDTRCRAVVELKDPDIAISVAMEIAGAAMVQQCVAISFDPASLRTLRKHAPGLSLGLLLNSRLTGSPPERAKRLAKSSRECGAGILDLHYSMLDRELIQELHNRGLLVWCWTVNDPVVLTALERWGIDGVTTDRPHDIR